MKENKDNNKICRIIWTGDDKTLEELLVANSKQIKRTKEKIAITYSNKENAELAKSIAKDLKTYLYDTDCKKAPIEREIKSNWRIIVCDKNELPEEKDEEILYKYCGMILLQKERKIFVYADGGKGIKESERDKLICEYEEVIKLGLEKKEEAKKRLDQWKEDHKEDPVNSKLFDKILNKMGNLVDKSFEKLDKLPDWLNIIIGIPTLLVELVLMVVGGFLFALPAGISEIAFKATVEGLKSSKFSKKFVRDAQEQIVRVRMYDFFKNERYHQLHSEKRQSAVFDEIK